MDYSCLSRITTASQVNLRNKGLHHLQGQIYKGCVKNAFTKLSIGSIPANYESIIYPHQQKQGFGTTQHRFFPSPTLPDQELMSANPQPSASGNTTHSNRGFGRLITRQKREWRHINDCPGPEQYQYDQCYSKPCGLKRKAKAFIILVKTGVAKKAQKENDVPGPGSYDLRDRKCQSRNQLGCKSSFESKVNRQGYVGKSITPGPGAYSNSQQKTGEEELREKQKDQYFKEQQRGGKLQYQKRPVMVLLNQKPLELPGPGSYDTTIPTFKPIYEKIKISNNFMQTDKDRFNNPNQRAGRESQEHQVSLNPCSYDLVSSFDEIPHKLIDLSCFMSETKRNIFSECKSRLGPNLSQKNAEPPTKYFHFNIRGGWV